MGQGQKEKETISKAAKIMIGALIGLMMFFINEAIAVPLKCQATAPQGYATWRIIDGKKCWYPGRRHIDKGMLYWEREQPPEIEEEKPMPAPAIRAQSDFEDRWEGLRDRENLLEPAAMEGWKLWQ
jgi:hypothetical protein